MTPNLQKRQNAIARCRERRIVIPTLAQQRNPARIPEEIRRALPGVDMQALDPLNLFRITWHNDPATGGFGPVTALELPSSLTGVPARIVGLVGKHFPTGAHKVGAAFGCLVPRLVSGEFDPTTQKAVWPSTGNYCRGGAFDSALLGCQAVAILPEEMSQERFRWLESIGAEIIATPGCESNVKEIFDACWEIRHTQPQSVIFNQFEECGNYLWHFGVTAPAAEEVFARLAGPTDRLRRLGERHRLGRHAGRRRLASSSASRDAASPSPRRCSARPCCATASAPTASRASATSTCRGSTTSRNSDLVTAIDDEAAMRVFRLFCEPAGHAWLGRPGRARRGGRAAPPAGHLLGLQHAVGHQDGTVLRARRARPPAHLLHRLGRRCTGPVSRS